MYFSKYFTAAAALTCYVPLIKAALSATQIIADLQQAQSALGNANTAASGTNTENGPADFRPIVTTNNAIAEQLLDFDQQIQGTGPLTFTNQQLVAEVVGTFTQTLSGFFNTLSDQAGDFQTSTGRSAISISASGLENAAVAFLQSIRAITPNVLLNSAEQQGINLVINAFDQAEGAFRRK
ncbi:MAG: hypothetical protein Q9196_001642 [Gyalolechia fulgens]